MNSPSKDIKDLLEDSGSGIDLVYAENLFCNLVPDVGVDNILTVTVLDSPGDSPYPGTAVYDRPGIMVYVRGVANGYTAAYEMAADISTYLHNKHNETINSTRYISIFRVGDINWLGFDENQRPMFSINFAIQRTTTA